MGGKVIESALPSLSVARPRARTRGNQGRLLKQRSMSPSCRAKRAARPSTTRRTGLESHQTHHHPALFEVRCRPKTQPTDRKCSGRAKSCEGIKSQRVSDDGDLDAFGDEERGHLKAHKRVVMKGKKPKDSEQKLETTGREEARFNHERCVGAETPSLSERKEKPLSSARPAAELRGAGENLRHRHRPTRESKRRTENTARVAENVDELAKQASLEKEQRRAEIYAINSLMRAAFERELAAYTLAKKEQAQGTIGTDESVPGLYVAEVE